MRTKGSIPFCRLKKRFIRKCSCDIFRNKFLLVVAQLCVLQLFEQIFYCCVVVVIVPIRVTREQNIVYHYQSLFYVRFHNYIKSTTNPFLLKMGLHLPSFFEPLGINMRNTVMQKKGGKKKIMFPYIMRIFFEVFEPLL